MRYNHHRSATIIVYAILLCAIPSFFSCNKATPAGFWKNYHSELLQHNSSDQGPRGGHRAMYWKKNQPNTFNQAEIIGFAHRNGWSVIGSSGYTAAQTNSWTYENKQIFPLTNTGFSDTLHDDRTFEYFPRWFSGPLTVLKFKTGWVTIEPGTDNAIEENGFVLINSDGTEMAVYHLWGE